jgi:hypothetical protein
LGHLLNFGKVNVMAMEAALKGRVAQIHVGAKGDKRALRVFHPGKLQPAEIGKIDNELIRIVEGLTGCACLSGTIDVIWEQRFDRVLNVQLDG